jgi:hypothetical protein
VNRQLDSALVHTVNGAVAALYAHDRAQGIDPERGRMLRILKIGEEYGELAQAVIGECGQNPRKGRTHTVEDIRAELRDVVLAAMIALVSWDENVSTADPGWFGDLVEHVEGRIARVAEAMAEVPAAGPGRG